MRVLNGKLDFEGFKMPFTEQIITHLVNFFSKQTYLQLSF